jgi:uncharacterized protein (TIGR03435 family)
VRTKRLDNVKVRHPRIAALLAILACTLSDARAQRPEFEVASLKSSPPAQGDTIVINGLGTFRGGRLTFTNASLSDLLKFAYRMTSDAQLVGPEWIASKMVRFDIEALAAPDTPRNRLELMMQALLADRLKLAAHHEQRELRYLSLAPGKDGSKMRTAQEPPIPDTGYNVAGRVVRNHLSMPQLALLIARFEKQPVIDTTGLEGFYEVKLEWAPSNLSAQEPAEPAVGPSIYNAVQTQLGLKLEARKGPLDVLVVDNALKVPTEN